MIGKDTIAWLAGLPTKQLILTLAQSGRVNYNPEDREVLEAVIDKIRQSTPPEEARNAVLEEAARMLESHGAYAQWPAMVRGMKHSPMNLCESNEGK